VLPGWQDALADGTVPHYQRDCSNCMKHLSPQQRQYLRCGYLPPVATSTTGTAIRTWVPGYLRDELATLETCPGYTTTLPEVEEVRQVYPAYKAGYAEELLGERPTRETIAACIVLDNAANARDAQRMKDAQEERHGPR
jgi:hypothetical protein